MQIQLGKQKVLRRRSVAGRKELHVKSRLFTRR